MILTVMASILVASAFSNEANAATDIGTFYPSSGDNESSSDALYSVVSGSAEDFKNVGTIFMSNGGTVTIHTLNVSPDYYISYDYEGVTDVELDDWGLTYYEDREGDYISGTLSKTGTLTLSFGGESDTFEIVIEVMYSEEITIDSIGGTEATVGYEYRYDVQTTPSTAEISISGVDWLDVSGHTISGTPAEAGDYTLIVTADLDGYLSATETVYIHVSEEQASEGLPELGDIYYSVSSSDPYSLTFYVSAENASTISWDFGDGNVSASGSDVTHVYSSSGSYTVRVTATNSEGSVSKTIDVLIADKSPATTVQYNHSYSFTVGIDTDGLTPTVSGCPFLTVTDGGDYVTVSGIPSSTSYVGQSYDVVLTVGDFTMSWTLTVTEGSTEPTAGFTYEIDGLTVIVTSTASNADMTFYQWTDGGSFVQSNTGTTRYTYSEPGTYTITQRVTATVDGQTITDEFSATITVDEGGSPVPTPEPEDGMVQIVGIAMAIMGTIVLIAGAYTGNYIIAAIAAVIAVAGAVLWWMF